MAVEDLTRRRFVQGSAAVGGSIALAGPLSALAAHTAEGHVKRAVGYGPLRDTREEDSGEVYLQLPKGFRYRVISRDYEPMSDGNPTPGIFDGTGSYPGPRNTTILIRNHENRSQPNEIRVEVPAGKRYDPDPNVRGGNTKLVVDNRTRRVIESFAVLGGTHTNCAGGVTPWRTWITCEEIFNYGAAGAVPGTGVPHGFAFEVPADARRPVTPIPIVAAGRFAREAVAWLGGILYQTEDRNDAAFYRFVPDRKPGEWGDLATFGGTLEALVVRNQPNFDADTAAPGSTYPVEWVAVDEPNPVVESGGQSTRAQAQAKGAAIFTRTEGIWQAGGRIYFDCTSGGDAGAGQLWEYTPGGTLKLIFESPGADVLDAPDNLVVVPETGDVFLQEDGGGEQFVRGVTRRGEIYDFAKTVLNGTEFCGGCFGADGKTFFVSQQGERVAGAPSEDSRALTCAIWGPFHKD
jgi:hypothetical protein